MKEPVGPVDKSHLMCMRRNFLLLASFLGLLAGCAAPPASPIPTAYPPDYLPTVIALTADAANHLGTEVAFALTPTLSPTDIPAPTLSPAAAPHLYADDHPESRTGGDPDLCTGTHVQGDLADQPTHEHHRGRK